jgi:hypothetical protein
MARPAAVALAVYVVVMALFAAFVAVPFATKKRDIPAEVPSPPALRVPDLVVVRAAQRLCMAQVALSAQTRGARFAVGTYRRPGPPLDVTVRAPGYSAHAALRGGYADNTSPSVSLPAPKSSRIATVCVRNDGRHKVALYAASDSARSRVQPTLDGKPVFPTPALSLTEGRRVSLIDSAGVTAGRIAVFRGFLEHTWIVWLLAISVVVGVPVLAGVALVASQRQLRSDSSAE